MSLPPFNQTRRLGLLPRLSDAAPELSAQRALVIYIYIYIHIYIYTYIYIYIPQVYTHCLTALLSPNIIFASSHSLPERIAFTKHGPFAYLRSQRHLDRPTAVAAPVACCSCGGHQRGVAAHVGQLRQQHPELRLRPREEASLWAGGGPGVPAWTRRELFGCGKKTRQAG